MNKLILIIILGGLLTGCSDPINTPIGSFKGAQDRERIIVEKSTLEAIIPNYRIPEPKKTDKLYVHCDILNVRKEPRVDSESLGKVTRGEELEWVSTFKEGGQMWYEVRYGNISRGTGYVSAQFVDFGSPDQKPQKAEVIEDVVNVRENPLMTSNVITKVHRGDPLNILSERFEDGSKWYKVELPEEGNKIGYIYALYVKLEEDPATTIVAEKPETESTEPSAPESEAPAPVEEPKPAEEETPSAPEPVAPPQEFQKFRGKVTADVLNVRSRSDAQAEGLAKLAKDDEVEVLAVHQGAGGKVWYEISLKILDQPGFVAGEFIEKIE